MSHNNDNYKANFVFLFLFLLFCFDLFSRGTTAPLLSYQILQCATGMSEKGDRGAIARQFLADQLTLFGPRGQILPTILNLALSDLWSVRRLCASKKRGQQ